MTTLSVIIPCFNCEATLEEAVSSVFRQESPIPFDLTMVDDGSGDGTYRLMQSLAGRFPNTRLVRHAVNQGGGATRNATVANSDGDLIFCLDSDDMLGPDFLQNMITFWLEKQCDGLGISKSIKFRQADVADVAYVTEFEGAGTRVRFEQLSDSSSCSLYSTFLITRKAFERIGGYPTAHGFDTQGMAFRFLCNGMQAYTCPGTVYYHRVSFHQSYFIREDQAHRYNWNWLQILSEFLYLFSDETKRLILGHELVPSEAALTVERAVWVQAARRPILVSNHAELMQLGRDRVAVLLEESTNPYDQYWLGEYWLSKEQPARALDHLRTALAGHFSHWQVWCRLVEAGMKISGDVDPVTFTYPRMRIQVSPRGMTFDAMIPTLGTYQRFENWLMRRRATRPFGRVLKFLRLGLRSRRHAEATGKPEATGRPSVG